MSPNNAAQRVRQSHDHEFDSAEAGILNERILMLVFESMKWDIKLVCLAAQVSRKLRAIAKRILWRQLCMYRAPRMVSSLMRGAPSSRIAGGWPALAKLMFFCCGCDSTRNFKLSHPFALPGHFVSSSRFSKTSGRSFLPKKCRDDLLYVSDPCEHQLENDHEDLGVYRGIFKGFMKSRTRACLIRRQVALEDRVCPYCGARVWSMTTARLVPKSAARRLGSRDGRLEYYVCVNGHLHGTCWLIPLSTDEDVDDDDDDDDDDYCVDSDGGDGGDGDGQTLTDGSMSSVGEEIVGEGLADFSSIEQQGVRQVKRMTTIRSHG